MNSWLSDVIRYWPDKGKISAAQAKKKAEEEYDIFNKTQRIDSDFDMEVRGLLDKEWYNFASALAKLILTMVQVLLL